MTPHPELEPGYYLATKNGVPWLTHYMEVSPGRLAWVVANYVVTDPRENGATLAAIPLRVQLPEPTWNDDQHGDLDEYVLGFNDALKQCREALAKAGIGCGP